MYTEAQDLHPVSLCFFFKRLNDFLLISNEKSNLILIYYPCMLVLL